LAELQLLVDDVVMKSFPLDKDTILIGRSPDNNIVIDEESVSTEHARVDLIPNQLMDGLIDIFIEDLGSTNGTFVNHVPVKRQQLQNFDYIRIAFTDFKLVADKKAKLAKTTVILPDR
jgi:pSer/pThr/pTyr-binding forkhead associated (FHA) protein